MGSKLRHSERGSSFRHPELVEGSDTPPPLEGMRTFYVYILSNSADVLYIGVTGNLEGRFWEHTEERSTSSSKFCLRYNLDKLVFYEDYPTAREAIAREKQLKGWRREKKIALIEAMNPGWKDLSGRLHF